MSERPEDSNLYGSVSLTEPKKAAELLQSSGWSVRKAGFAEFESKKEGVEMLIEASEPVLIHGLSANPEVTAEKLAEIFRRAKVSFTFEIYDSVGHLTRKIDT